MERTPETGGELIRDLHYFADGLRKDLQQDCPEGDKAFDTRLHQCILMLQRFERQVKVGG